MIYSLSNELIFPDPALAEEDGLLAIGGDLSTERLLLAYKSGIFPWFNEGSPILWFSPHQRCVLFPEKVYVSTSMKRWLRSARFAITCNTAFVEVVHHCATVRRKDQDGTWITQDMQDAYAALHEIKVAQSIEVWAGRDLVGGMYGVIVGRVFCGESMFSLQPNASKAAMIWLCNHGGFKLIDCQLPNDHLIRMGAEMIDQQAFLQALSGKPVDSSKR